MNYYMIDWQTDWGLSYQPTDIEAGLGVMQKLDFGDDSDNYLLLGIL